MFQRRTKQFFEASPAWSFWGDALVGFDLSLTTGFAMRGFHPLFCDEAQRDAASASLGSMLSAMPDNTVLRFYSMELSSYVDDLARFAESLGNHGLGKFLADEKTQMLAGVDGPVRREIFCFLSTPGTVHGAGLAPSTLKSGILSVQRTATMQFEEQREKLVAAAHALKTNLRELGVEAQALSAEEIFSCTWRLANPLRSLMFGAPPLRTDVPLRTQLFASGLENDADSFVRDGQYHRVVSLSLPPQQVSPAEILKLQDLPFRNIVVVTLRRIPQARALRRLDGSRHHAWQWKAIARRIHGARADENPDHVALNKQDAANAAYQTLVQGDSLYDVAVQVWFCAPDKLQLDRQTEHLFSVTRRCGNAEAAIEEYRAPFAYLSMLPGHHVWMGKRYHPMLASRAADLLPIYQEPAGTPEPSCLFTTRGNALFGWAPFMEGLNAHNGLVLGTTGAGKSFWMRCALLGFLAQGGHVIIITRGSDYHRYAAMLKGDLHDVRTDDPNLALGPFLPTEAADSTYMDQLTSILAMMASTDGKEIGRVQKRLISEACRKLYESWNGAEAPTLHNWLAVLRSMSEERQSDREAIRQLESEMLYWLEGPQAGIFTRNRKHSDARLSVWNLEHVRDRDTQGVMLGLIGGDIARALKRNRVFVWLDEGWDVLDNPVGAAMFNALQRTIRKEKGALFSGTHSVNDFATLGDKLESAMLSCSPVHVILEQKTSELPDLQRLLQIDDATMQVIGSLKTVVGSHSSALLALGDQKQVVELRPSPTEYWMATSHPKDVEVEDRVLTRYPKHSRTAIVKALAEKLPKGAAHVA